MHDLANRLLEDSNFAYAYDANGNLIEKMDKGTGDRTVYTYDAENQLIRVEKFTPTGGTTAVPLAEYHYDALGRRIEKVVNGVSTRFVYDNEDIVAEVDGTGATQAISLHGPGIDEPLAGSLRSGAGGGTFTYHADGLGSISTLTDLNGDQVRTYTYDSFGRIVAETGTVVNPFTYTGREFGPETGLYYYRTRYYDPNIGRFLEEDRFRGFTPSPSTLNVFAYVGNNPANFIDPLGLQGTAVLTPAGPILLPIPPPQGSQPQLSPRQIESIEAFFKLFDPRPLGQFILSNILDKIDKGQPITPADLEEASKPPKGLVCLVELPTSPPGLEPPPPPKDPRFKIRLIIARLLELIGRHVR